jgi:hypothetical protein
MFRDLILGNTDNSSDTSLICNPHVHTYVGIKPFSTLQFSSYRHYATTDHPTSVFIIFPSTKITNQSLVPSCWYKKCEWCEQYTAHVSGLFTCEWCEQYTAHGVRFVFTHTRAHTHTHTHTQVVSKILQTGAVIYTAFVVAWKTSRW